MRCGGLAESAWRPARPYARRPQRLSPLRSRTLRASMSGWELGGRQQGLREWFTAQRGGAARGYTRAVFSGPTTPVLSSAILAAVEHHPDLGGTWHVAAEPIAKHDLLLALREA